MLTSLKLENFRNHLSKEVKLDVANIIIGNNGIGKSNILEAVCFASCCRSFREDDKKNLVNYDSNYARITADDLELFIQKTPRALLQVKHKGVIQKKAGHIGTLPAVVFSPETIFIVTGGPKDRRRFLDIMISQISGQYLSNLVNYEKVRTQRNNLLQLISQCRAKEDELSFWDNELVTYAREIIAKRELAVLYLNKIISHYYEKISNEKVVLELSYEQSGTGDMLSDLRLNRRREICSGHTVIGPHRDDVAIRLNNLEVSKYASRGESRSVILALKMGEIDFISDSRQDSPAPILLLDDIFSEFDINRRNHLADLFEKYQTIVTTTDESFLNDGLKKKANIIRLE